MSIAAKHLLCVERETERLLEQRNRSPVRVKVAIPQIAYGQRNGMPLIAKLDCDPMLVGTGEGLPGVHLFPRMSVLTHPEAVTLARWILAVYKEDAP